jgi:hypothetical protein
MYVLVNIDATSKADSTVFQNFDELYKWVVQKNGAGKLQEEVAAGVVSKLQSFLSSLLPQGAGQTAAASVLPFEEPVGAEKNQGTMIDFEDEENILEGDSRLPGANTIVEEKHVKPIREVMPLLKAALGTVAEPYNSQYFNKKIGQLRAGTYGPDDHIPTEMLWLQNESAMIPTYEVHRMTDEISDTFFRTLERPSLHDDKESVETIPFGKPKLCFELKGLPISHLGFLCPAIFALKEWFLSTFCDSITNTDIDIHYTSISFKACVSLFLHAPIFCTSNSYMTPMPLNIPTSAMKYLNEYDIETMLLYITQESTYKIKRGYFNLFFDILKNVRKGMPSYYLSQMPKVVTPMSSFLYDNFDNWESLISETLVNYGTGKISKSTFKDWIIPFVSHELKQTDGSSTKSSEIYTLWNSFLKRVVTDVKDRKFVKTFTEAVSIQQFSKAMKSMGFEIVRKSAGMFYQGLEKRESAGESNVGSVATFYEISGYTDAADQYAIF